MQDLLTRGIDEQGNIRSEETHEFKDSVLGRIPKEWEVVEQKSIVDFVNGRAYKLSEWEKEGTPVIRLQNLTGNGDSYYYSNLKLPEKQYVNHGDLLYMWSATFGAVIWQGAKAIFHYHIWRVVVSSIIDLKFMYYKLCDLTQKLLHQSNGSTMLHVTKEYMEKYLVVIPKDVDEQKKIAEAITSFDERLEHEKAQLNKLKFLKTGLMQDLLTGKVRVDALINKAQETI
jgi:type I restriction enzyme S subunit